MGYPKISVVTPAFNSEKFLEETIISVLGQNYPNLEYIIIDGGSTDRTVEIIRKYEANVSYWISEPDKGMYHAIQKGFEKSTGEIMAWLNSDDKYHPDALKIVADIFTDLDNIEWILGMPSFINKKGQCVKTSENKRWSKSRLWIGDYRWIQQESVFWRRSLWEKAGSHVSVLYKYAGDFELWCRFFEFAELINVTTPLSGFRLHGDQISLKYSDIYENEVGEIMKLFNNSRSEDKKLNWTKHLWRCSNYLMNLNFKPAKMIAFTISHLVDKRLHFPPRIYYDFVENKWKI